MTALHVSAANGNADIGQMLANRDAKLDAKDMVSFFSTFYHYCTETGMDK